MTKYLHLLDYALWFSIIAMQWFLCGVASRRGVARMLPRYMLFLFFVSLQSTSLVVVSFLFSYSAYFWAFYIGMALETALMVGVVYDIFKNEFHPVDVLPAGSIAQVAVSLVIIAVVAITLAMWRPAVNAEALVALCRTAHRTSEFVVCCSLWSVVLYARSLGIPWRSRVAGIARGFLVYLTFQAVTTAGVAFAGAAWVAWLSRAGIASYLVALVLWFRAVRQPEEISLELPTPDALLGLMRLMGQMRPGTRQLREIKIKF